MAVPAHDTRDYEFAVKYDIPIHWVVTPEDKSLTDSRSAFPGQGTIINSSNSTLGLDINGLHSKEAASKVIEWAEKTKNGKKKVHFSVYLKLKDRAKRFRFFGGRAEGWVWFVPCTTFYMYDIICIISNLSFFR
jgi:leucyl-tRNA synthetase